MALQPCPNCGKQINASAPRCKYCGWNRATGAVAEVAAPAAPVAGGLSRFRRLLLIGAGVLLLLCVLLGSLANVRVSQATPTPAPGATVAAVARAATVAPASTATRLPATATRAPAATTAPTVAPTPIPPSPTAPTTKASQYSAEEEVYAKTIRSQSELMSQSMTRFGQLLQNPKFLDDRWRLDVALVLATWRAILKDAKTMPVPVRFHGMHGTYVQALEHYDQAANEIVYALDNPTAKDAASRMTGARDKIQEGNRLITEAVAQFPAP